MSNFTAIPNHRWLAGAADEVNPGAERVASLREVAALSSLGRDSAALYRTAVMGAVLALAAVLRFYGLARQGAWADEITTLLITDPSQSFGRFWQLVLADTHPPFYYLLMRWWFALFGQSDLAGRLPSAIFGILTVGAAAVAFRPYRFRARTALMLFLALSPGAIEYAQEARSYSLLLFLSTVVTGACFRFIRSLGEEGSEANRAIIVLTLAGMVASYTHYFGFLIAVAAGLTAAAAAWGTGRRYVAPAVGLASMLAVFLPWVVYHTHDMSYGVRVSAWIADFPVSATTSWFMRLWLGGTPGLGGLALALLAMPSFFAFARRDVASWVALALPLLTLAGALAISWYVPVLTSRNLIVVLPALYLGMASIVDYAAARWAASVSGICLSAQLLLMTQSLPWYYTARTKEQWRESADFVLAQPGCTAGSIYVYGEGGNYRYLLKGRPRIELIEIPEKGGALPPLPSAADCSVLLWAADLPRSRFDAILSALPMDGTCVSVMPFYWAFVALRVPAGPASDSGCIIVGRSATLR